MLFQSLRRFLLLAAALAALPASAQASLPVPYAIVGCITQGRFHSNGLIGPELVSAELKALEGKTIRIEGLLWPGAACGARALFLVDQQCQAKLHRSYALCSPCRTMRDDPPAVMLPRAQDDMPIMLPGAAIKELSN
jgi:hypothetical protein